MNLVFSSVEHPKLEVRVVITWSLPATIIAITISSIVSPCGSKRLFDTIPTISRNDELKKSFPAN